eukprot:8327781-Heterocapsa_arctica.AAC.1
MHGRDFELDKKETNEIKALLIGEGMEVIEVRREGVLWEVQLHCAPHVDEESNCVTHSEMDEQE